MNKYQLPAGSTTNWNGKKLPYGWVMVKRNCFLNIHLIMKKYDDPNNTKYAIELLLKRLES